MSLILADGIQPLSVTARLVAHEVHPLLLLHPHCCEILYLFTALSKTDPKEGDSDDLRAMSPQRTSEDIKKISENAPRQLSIKDHSVFLIYNTPLINSCAVEGVGRLSHLDGPLSPCSCRIRSAISANCTAASSHSLS